MIEDMKADSEKWEAQRREMLVRGESVYSGGHRLYLDFVGEYGC